MGVINSHASSWEYRWEQTTIHIPVGDELAKYTHIPHARLYKDGVAVSDAYINYHIEGDWLYYLKDVDTQKVGIYYVWYKAFEYDKYVPGTCKGYKAKITFIVEDNIKPELDIIEPEIGFQRVKEQNKEDIDKILNSNVIAKDNYSKCSLFFEHNIDLTNVGRYKVIATANDEYNNRVSDYFYVNVYDNNYPVISIDGMNNVLKISRSSDVNIKDYFKAYDQIDGDISDKIIFPEIDLKKLGVNTYQVLVRNTSGNETKYEFILEVYDDVSPEIILETNNIILDYKTDFDNFDFNKYLVEIKDDNVVDYSNLIVKHNLENKIGNYFINYSYNDGINYVNNQIDVKLISFKSPILETTDVRVKLDDVVDLNKYIYVYDESDNYISESVQIDDSLVDYNKSGIYFADVYCINSSGQSNTKKLKIIIEPKEEKNNNMVFIIIFSTSGVILLISLSAFGLLIFKKKIKIKKSNI